MTFLISPLLLLYFIFCMCVSATALEGNYFDAIEKMFIAEEGRQATNVLQEDLASGYDSPKEVSVTYNTAPQISIKDLSLSADFDGSNICMTVKVNSPNFNFKLDVRCDEIEEGNFKMNNGEDTEKSNVEETVEQKVEDSFD